MKKITNFIINKRHSILVVFIILTILSCFLATKVEINGDLTKYLPADSKTKLGTEIMNEEFKGVETPGSLNLMFKGLQDEEKTKILDSLTNIKGVSKIDYDSKEDYTLYVINTDETSDSETSKNIYEEILDTYENYEIYTSGSIKMSNTEILPTWIMVTSILCALIILIIMCDSYLEPFLFLISIVIAVILNAGTNLIFGSISEVTNSISAILVMALSMDYSIMLMNRFRDERLKEKDDILAMKNALYNSFRAISSSSLTTIVGLITLVFMSFTIGRDLGLVLAKGVFLSLVSIFLCLPTLILTFDKWITKTEKKVFVPKLKTLANISYKLKLPITFIFVILFIGSTLLKGNLSILYASPEDDKIEEVFGANNQIAIIYKNDYEREISSYLPILEQNINTTSVQAYGNTLNQKLTYDNLNTKMTTLSENGLLEDYLLKILYYHYYNKDESLQMTLNEFYNFIIELKNDENFKDLITDEINTLKYFINPYEIEKTRTPESLSQILGIDNEQIKDILIYYNSKNNTLTLTLNEFITFLKNDILTNPKYSNLFNEETISQIDTLYTYTNKDFITEYFTTKELSNILNIPKNSIELILLSKRSQTDNGLEITLNEFTTQVIQLKTNTNFLDNIDITKIEILNNFTNTTYITTPLNKQVLSSIYPSSLVDLVYQTKNLTELDTITLTEFIKTVLIINENTQILSEEELKEFNLLSYVIDDTLNTSQKTFTSTQLSQLLNIDITQANSLYALIDYVTNGTNNWKINLNELINIILENEEITSSLDIETLNNLRLLKNIIDLTLQEKKLSSTNISDILEIEKTNIDLLYGIYITNYINKEISLNNLVNFILSDILESEEYSSLFTPQNKNDLKNIKLIMNDSLRGKKYSKEEMYNTLRLFTNAIINSDIDLMYIYYGSINEYNESWELTLEEIVNYLNDEIIKDSRFTKFINEETQNDIIKAKEQVAKAKSLLVAKNYSRIILNTKLDYESEETYQYIETINNDLKDIKEFYIVGDSSMAYEMDKTFAKEFNFISVLTIISLIIVVGIAFKSFIIPVILVLLIQTAVYLTMGILSITVGSVYFIAILVVQSILMGATIDYAIVYTSYYLENRKTLNVKESILKSYESSIHTIMTSASILIIVTLILGIFAKDITSKICMTISEGTLCSSLLILLVLPGTLAAFDKKITKKIKKYDKIK